MTPPSKRLPGIVGRTEGFPEWLLHDAPIASGPSVVSVVDQDRCSDRVEAVDPGRDPLGNAYTAVAGRVRRHVGPAVDRALAVEEARVVQALRAVAGELAVDVERAVVGGRRRLAGRDVDARRHLSVRRELEDRFGL